MKQTCFLLVVMLLAAILSACQAATPAVAHATNPPTADTTAPANSPAQPTQAVSPTNSPAEPDSTFSVTSSGIINGVIQNDYGARGTQKTSEISSRSFALSFQHIPEGTACLALSVIDPDGGNWVHWLAANVPVADLAQNASIDLASGMVQGKNDFGFVGYGGPTPPSGTHTYVITVYALSESLSLENGFSLKQFQKSIDGKVIATTVLTGDYSH
jgi:Raf kinase inhibitor-like YbhB/YbcL family protein